MRGRLTLIERIAGPDNSMQRTALRAAADVGRYEAQSLENCAEPRKEVASAIGSSGGKPPRGRRMKSCARGGPLVKIGPGVSTQ